MPNIGKLVGSLFSATNENTLALANLKFDFCLMKVEAPVEFSGLGEALSTRRRRDAEDGIHHKTARRLAALFEQLIPSTPSLITAYGLRSSEIIQTPGVNPEASPKYGPFEPFVGADGTAMWAAATSGIPALGVYLLACLLARAWDAKEAISIWAELVEWRRQEIMHGAKSNHAISDSSRLSILQDISREDLARWDASARAWLRSADQAKIKEQTQLMLIVKHAELPFHGGVSTYSKVIETWRQAMQGLENLLCGQPQEIFNGAILLAFSAWHLYPNLIVFGREIKTIKFEDQCVDSRGIGTIRLQHQSTSTSQGTSWSLALSHLRYYGNPVTVKSNADFSRLNIHELHIIALGSIFKSWGISPRNTLDVAQWFTELWDFLSRDASRVALDSLGWLKCLARAAKEVLRCNTSKESGTMHLLAHGQRRGKNFLGAQAGPLEPFFGLGNESVLAGLSQKRDEDRGVTFLRTVAKMYDWQSNDAYIVSNRSPLAGQPSVGTRLYMTAVPHTRKSRKRDVNGNMLTEVTHAKWLHVEEDQNLPRWSNDSWFRSALTNQLRKLSESGERTVRIHNAPFEVTARTWIWENPPFLFDYERHAQSGLASDTNVDSHFCASGSVQPNLCRCFDCDTEATAHDRKSPSFSFRMRIGAYSLFFNDKAREREVKYEREIKLKGKDYLHPTAISERLRSLAVSADAVSSFLQFLVVSNAERHRAKSFPTLRETPFRHDVTTETEIASETETDADIETQTEADAETLPQTGVWHQYREFSGQIVNTKRDGGFRERSRQEHFSDVNYIQEIAKMFPVGKKLSRALAALALATQVYSRLDGATISFKVVDTPLDEAPWLPTQKYGKSEKRTEEGLIIPSVLPATLSRLNTLSCIAHLESGTLIMQPEEFEQTLAIASENSIFVIGVLLSDPFDLVPEDTVKRIIGNIGRTGICLLVAPFNSQIRPLGEQWNLVNHAAYNRKREDNFKSTSLHLSFTDWTLPLEVKGSGARTIDQEATLVEAVVSVLDSGKWVADLDILCIDFNALTRLNMTQECPGHPNGPSDYDYTALDTWEELLDQPKSVGFFRARGNWAARLAAVSILAQKDQGHSVGLLGPGDFCLDCLNAMCDTSAGLEEFESPLPSICID